VTHYQGSVPDYEQAPDWRTRAACRETDRSGRPVNPPELWFPIGETGSALLQQEEAKAICRRCWAMDHCLQYALEARIEDGVWGGLSENERRRIKRRAARH
jgi:WhiB family transcriptional regulator, redox-sensing transcriptional regulator